MEIPIDKNHLEELKKIARPMASSIYGDGERGFNFYEAWDLQEKGEIELPSLVDLLVARTEHYESVGEDKIRDYSEYKAKRNELVGKSLKLGLAGKMDEAAKVLEKQKELDDSFAEIRNQIRCFFSEFLPCWTKDGYGLAKNSQGVETEQFGSIDLVDGRTVPKDSFDLDLGVGFGGTFLRLTGVKKQGSLYVPVFSKGGTDDLNLRACFADDKETRKNIKSGSEILQKGLTLYDRIGFRPLVLGDLGQYHDFSVNPTSAPYRAKIWSLKK